MSRVFEIKRNKNNNRGIKYFCREKKDSLKPFSSPWLTDEIIEVIELTAYEALQAKLKIAVEALESIEWTTSYSDGSKDHCKADRTLVESALSKLEG